MLKSGFSVFLARIAQLKSQQGEVTLIKRLYHTSNQNPSLGLAAGGGVCQQNLNGSTCLTNAQVPQANAVWYQ